MSQHWPALLGLAVLLAAVAHSQRPGPDDTPPTGPACPHCGGGPLTPTRIGTVCQSCTRVTARRPT